MKAGARVQMWAALKVLTTVGLMAFQRAAHWVGSSAAKMAEMMACSKAARRATPRVASSVDDSVYPRVEHWASRRAARTVYSMAASMDVPRAVNSVCHSVEWMVATKAVG